MITLPINFRSLTMNLIRVQLLFMILLLVGCTNHVQIVGEVEADSPSPFDLITYADLPANMPRSEAMFADSIKAAVTDGKLPESLAWNNYLQIGHYNTVNKAAELALEWELDSITGDGLKDLRKYRLVDAEDYIVKQAQEKNLIIITEAHTKPQHRVFTRCLLDDLYSVGYRHLGLENILPMYGSKDSQPLDTNLQARGYPIQGAIAGIFPTEPEYSNLIRHAIKLGFKVFAYERNQSSDSERDLQQAEHIIDYQALHPGEKIICHGGWSHAVEERIAKYPGSNSYWLAYHYKTLTGDDPLTIYQDAMNKKTADTQKSSPYYTAIVEGLSTGGTPKVLVDDNGTTWHGPNGDMPFDIITVEPPLESRNGSGGWYSWACDGEKYRTIDIPQILSGVVGIEYPVIVELRRLYDSEIATPIYATELAENIRLPNVQVWDYNYRLDVKDSNGKKMRLPVDKK